MDRIQKVMISKNKPLRVAPARGNVQIASAWRLWAQGDEFYVASRDVISLGKISFHHNYNWQYRLGNAMFRLAPPIALSGNWLHALELAFLVGTDVLLPIAKPDSNVRLIETPLGAKLILNVLLTRATAKPNFLPPVEVGGTVLGGYRLRSGKSLLFVGRALRLTDDDQRVVANIRGKVRIPMSVKPKPEEIFAELAWHQFNPTGNVVAVIPVGLDSVTVGSELT